MYAGRDFSISDVGESEVFSFDFVNDLNTGETLLSVTFDITLQQGVDPDPSAHLDGGPGITGNVAMQRLTGLLPGCNYMLQAVATTSQGNTISLYSHVRCQVPY